MTFLAHYGWLIGLAIIGVAIWIAALVLVIRSSKFRRKWLWALLTLCTFSFARQVAPGVTVSAGLPLGALYVLGFWRWGSEPAGAARATRPTPANKVRMPVRLLAVRIGYALGGACCLGLGLLAGSGTLTSLVLEAGGPMPAVQPQFRPMLQALEYSEVAFAIVLAGIFGFLAVRPYGWGKLLCAWAGLSWLGFSLIFAIVAPQSGGPLTIAVGLAGALMLATAATHQIVDPALGGPPIRAG
jgi:hypothetical protein